MKFVCTSDFHGFIHSVWEDLVDLKADVLLVAGDICSTVPYKEMEAFDVMLTYLPFKHAVVIAGNHDYPLARGYQLKNATYLNDEAVTIDGIKIYGSPWTPIFGKWDFMLSNECLEKKWANIPNDVDILLTHTPPFGTLDTTNQVRSGCEVLYERLTEISPQFHVFGHIHESYGMVTKGETTYINCSWLLRNKPIEFEV